MLKPQPLHTKAQDAAEDIFFGQIAIIWARWFLIAAGAIVALWSADTMMKLTLAILIVVALMAINFFMHGRYLTGQPANKLLLLLTNLADVSIITFLVVSWNGHSGLDNDFFILYYPMLFAFALVFTPRSTILFTFFTLGLYAGACLLTTPQTLMFSTAGFELIVTRLVTLGAMGGLGTYYYRRQRDAYRAIYATALPQFK